MRSHSIRASFLSARSKNRRRGLLLLGRSRGVFFAIFGLELLIPFVFILLLFSIAVRLELLWWHIPEAGLLVVAHGQTEEVKGVKESEEKVAVILPTRTPHLRLAILGKEDVVIGRKIFARMPDVQHEGVEEHEGRLEDVEVSLGAVDSTGGALKVLHNAVDTADRDDGRRRVQQDQCGADVLAEHTSLQRLTVKVGSEHDKGNEAGGLQDQRDLEKALTDLAVLLVKACIDQTNDAIDGKRFDDRIQAKEGCEHTAWVQGREIGNVEQDARQDEVVCQGIDRPGSQLSKYMS